MSERVICKQNMAMCCRMFGFRAFYLAGVCEQTRMHPLMERC